MGSIAHEAMFRGQLVTFVFNEDANAFNLDHQHPGTIVETFRGGSLVCVALPKRGVIGPHGKWLSGEMMICDSQILTWELTNVS